MGTEHSPSHYLDELMNRIMAGDEWKTIGGRSVRSTRLPSLRTLLF